MLKLSKNFFKLFLQLPGWNLLASAALLFQPARAQFSLLYQRPTQHKNISIFSHYESTNQIQPYIIDYLKALNDNGFDVIFISTCEALSVRAIEPFCHKIIFRKNIGGNFACYKLGIEYIHRDYEKLLLTNNSIALSSQQLINIFLEMNDNPCWGIVTNYERNSHLPSIFLMFDKQIWQSRYFKKFWRRVKLLKNQNLAFSLYEMGLPVYLRQNGVKLSTSKAVLNTKV